MRNSSRALLLLWLAGLASCATTPTRFVHRNADLGAIQTVAVLPFTGVDVDRASAEKVHRVFLVELMAVGAVDVVEPGRVAKLMATERIKAVDQLDPEDLKRIGQQLGADGLFLGTVVDFELRRSGNLSAPEVTIQTQLVEVQSGVTVWSASDTRSGATATRRLFGFGGDSLTDAARKLIRKQLHSLVG